MRTISVWLCILTLAIAIEDVQDSLAKQDQRITSLEGKINDLSGKVSQPTGGDYASADDLKKLAEQVQEIDKKREEDNQKILDAFAKLGGKVRKSDPTPTPPPVETPGPPSTPTPNGPQQGYYYKIEANNTLSAIAKAYRAQGIKVSVEDILKANPGLNANKLVVGQKIFIPSSQ
jgi:LysM repeat protein